MRRVSIISVFVSLLALSPSVFVSGLFGLPLCLFGSGLAQQAGQISPSSRSHGAPPAVPIPTKVEGRSLL